MNKQQSSHSLCAKAIRNELKLAFPQTKFRVISSSYSMGSSVDIYWTDGVTREQVEKISNKYQYGEFNGMEDIYEHSNSRKDIPQVKFVMTQRTLSHDIQLKTAKVIKEHYADLENLEVPLTKEDLGKSFRAFGQWSNWSELVWRVLSKIDLTNAIGIKQDENFTSGCIYDGFLAVKNEA